MYHLVVLDQQLDQTTFHLGCKGNGVGARKMIDAGFSTVLVEPGDVGASNARRRGSDSGMPRGN